MRDLLSKLDSLVSETALQSKEDLEAKQQALDDLEADPVASNDPEISSAIDQRRADLEKEAKAKGFAESFEIGDAFGISFSEDHEIATEIVDILEDGIVVELDDTALNMLTNEGLTFLDGEVVTEEKKKGVAEAQLDEATARDVLLGLLDKFYADMKLPPRQGSHTGLLDIKSPGTKVWTRGDGTRLRDPGRIQASHWADDKKQAEKAATKFWPWLLKQPGVKSIGQVSGQFGSSPMTDAVSYKGLYFSGGPYGTEFGSMSRVKNPKSVWRHKPFELEPKAEQGVAEEKQKGVDGKACWKGYKRMGTKMKGGKRVDNCVKMGEDLEEEQTDEAKYQGKEVPLGKKLPGDVKKSKVYVRKPDGKVVKVNFGDKKMRIKKSNPARRKSFRARHNCKNPGPRWKARYWSCRSW